MTRMTEPFVPPGRSKSGTIGSVMDARRRGRSRVREYGWGSKSRNPRPEKRNAADDGR